MPTLEITTMVGCPLMCTFCPQEQLKGSYGRQEKFLSFERFEAILAKVPPYVRIDFSGMAEPWAAPDATAMLRLALKRGYSVAIYTTLVGMDDPEVVAELLLGHREQVEAVSIHLPDAQGNMKGFRLTDAYERALNVFLRIALDLRWFEMMTMHRDHALHPALAHLEEHIVEWHPLTRAGSLNLSQIGEQPIEASPQHATPVSCSYTPFYDQNVLLPNGDVVLCCMDYGLKHVVGNLLRQDYHEIFGSPGMARVHAENTKVGFSDCTICRSCSRAQPYTLWHAARQFWEKQP